MTVLFGRTVYKQQQLKDVTYLISIHQYFDELWGKSCPEEQDTSCCQYTVGFTSNAWKESTEILKLKQILTGSQLRTDKTGLMWAVKETRGALVKH